MNKLIINKKNIHRKEMPMKKKPMSYTKMKNFLKKEYKSGELNKYFYYKLRKKYKKEVA